MSFGLEIAVFQGFKI